MLQKTACEFPRKIPEENPKFISKETFAKEIAKLFPKGIASSSIQWSD